MKDRRILVTGGSGFIGGFTSEAQIGLGAEVVYFDMRHPERMGDLVTFAQGDLTNAEVLISTCQDQGIDTIVHLADYGTTEVSRTGEVVFKRHTRVKILTEAGYDQGTVSIPYYHADRTQRVKRVQGQTFFLDPDGNVQRQKMDKKAVFTEDLNGKSKSVGDGHKIHLVFQLKKNQGGDENAGEKGKSTLPKT